MGYDRSRYKNEYIKFLTYALASCDETRDHLEMLYETGALTDKILYEDLCKRYDILGRKINNFRQSVISNFLAPDDLNQQNKSAAQINSEDDE